MNDLPRLASAGNPIERALLLARGGLAVFPLRPNKRPFDNVTVAAAIGIPTPQEGQGGAKLATRDEAAISRLWTALPGAQIGIATGAVSGGLIVLDVDRKNGRDGLQTLSGLGYNPPATVWQQTQSGGLHYLYRGPVGRHLPTDADVLGAALDRRGDGGYIVDYGLFDPASPLTAAPDWILTGNRSPDGRRHELGDPALAAPSFQNAVQALNAHDPNNLGRDKWIATTAQFKQATASLVPEPTARLAWDIWCNRYDQNDVHENERQWRSIKNTTAGWTALRDNSPARAKLLLGSGGNVPALPELPPQQLDGYEQVISTATGDNGKNTLIETVKILHGNIPVAFDEFTQTVVAASPLPWDRNANYPRQWTETDTIHCQLYVQALFIRPGKETVYDAITIIANRHRQHQVRDYLSGLQWDGLQRLPFLSSFYFGANDTPYGRAICTKFMIGAVARIMQPGCKMDSVLVLEGTQGKLKSSAIAELASVDWFADELPDLHTKDAAIQLAGKWIVEVSELSALKRSDVETIKKFMSRSIDRYRAPYERIAADHRRQCVFIATTNEEQYLKDQTGNRRFWPLTCGTINIDAIKRDRNQFWAEALVRYRNGERWWFEGDETRLAESEQEERREVDPWEDRIKAYADALGGMPISIENICTVLGIPFERMNAGVNKRIAQCLVRAGYMRRRMSEGNRPWRYIKIN